MRRALVDGVRVDAQPKLRGECIRCGGEMIAKCGRVKVWHWAHKGEPPCDPWWENETEWHRDWKDRFPVDWQEIIAEDPVTGERHIADVRTPHGLVIEFQHSVIDPAEVQSREAFYGNMIWIVDGLRGGLDGQFFQMGVSRQAVLVDPIGHQIEWLGRGRLFHNWSQVGAKVFLDFGGELLWLLAYYDRDKKRGVVGPIHKWSVVEDCIEGREIRKLFRRHEDNPPPAAGL